ncbi:MAG: acetolactate synthase small subunit [Pseudomonadota bacterium]
MRHVISVLMQNEVGALTRLTCLFSTRGYNIESLNVAPTDDPLISRLTVVTTGSDAAIDQITKQMSKQIDVVDMIDMTLGDHFERELALIKLRVPADTNDAVAAFCQTRDARVLDDTCAAFTVEFAGSTAEVDALVAELQQRADVLALVRSGSLGISRGARVLAGEMTPAVAERQQATTDR